MHETNVISFKNSNLGSVSISDVNGSCLVNVRFGRRGEVRTFIVSKDCFRGMMVYIREAAAYGVRLHYPNGIIVNKTTVIDVPGADECKFALIKFLNENGMETTHGSTSFAHSVRG